MVFYCSTCRRGFVVESALLLHVLGEKCRPRRRGRPTKAPPSSPIDMVFFKNVFPCISSLSISCHFSSRKIHNAAIIPVIVSIFVRLPFLYIYVCVYSLLPKVQLIDLSPSPNPPTCLPSPKSISILPLVPSEKLLYVFITLIQLCQLISGCRIPV